MTWSSAVVLLTGKVKLCEIHIAGFGDWIWRLNKMSDGNDNDFNFSHEVNNESVGVELTCGSGCTYFFVLTFRARGI